MLATLGQFFFRFGLAVVIVSTFMSVALLVSVGKVPDVLARTSAIASILTGDYLASVGKIVTYASLGLGLAGLVTAMRYVFGGSVTYIQLFQPYVMLVYLTLFTIACDGCVTAVSLLIDMYAGVLGMFGGNTVLAVKGTIIGLIMTTTSYYILVKGFGAPAE